MGPEPAWEQGDGIGLFLKDEFAGEEVFERDELGVVGDRSIRALFEGQHNIDPEAIIASGAFLASAHDSVGSSGNDHEPFLDNLKGKLEGHLVVRIIRGGAGRAENTDLAPIAIGMKDAEGMT